MADTTTPQVEVEMTETETKTEQDPTVEETLQDQDRAGGEKAILADLARERAKRKDADQKVAAVEAKLAALATALGVETTEKVDPDALRADLDAQRRENAILRAGAALRIDTDALLDSRRFTDGLTDVDPTDQAAVKAYLEGFIQEHPQYAPTGNTEPATPYVRDAAAVRTPTHKQSTADIFAAATGQQAR